MAKSSDAKIWTTSYSKHFTLKLYQAQIHGCSVTYKAHQFPMTCTFQNQLFAYNLNLKRIFECCCNCVYSVFPFVSISLVDIQKASIHKPTYNIQLLNFKYLHSKGNANQCYRYDMVVNHVKYSIRCLECQVRICAHFLCTNTHFTSQYTGWLGVSSCD